MKWNIEYSNGLLIEEGVTKFNIDNFSLINKVYFTDKYNQYGFNRDGMFFINKQIFNFKINLDNFTIKPFQHKTGMMTFNSMNSNNKIYSWSIGYDLINNENEFHYEMIITYQGEVYFHAKDIKNNTEKILKLL